MEEKSRFEAHLEMIEHKDASQGLNDAAIFVHDALVLARRAATGVFGDEPTPQVVLEVYDRIVAKQRELIAVEAAEVEAATR